MAHRLVFLRRHLGWSSVSLQRGLSGCCLEIKERIFVGRSRRSVNCWSSWSLICLCLCFEERHSRSVD